MPESMFGRPSQHLLPSNPPVNPSSSDPQPPVVPLDFKDFRFNSIGKQPELLSRISLPQFEHMDYHTPTPSPTYTPPPNSTNVQSQSSSRRTLLQQLAGSEPGALDGSSRWHASASQSNGSLASRIQTNLGPPSDIAHRPTTGYSFFGRLTGDASLIPPVEVLSQPPDSSPPSPVSFAPTIEPTTSHNSPSSLLISTTSARTSRIPTPIATATTNAVPGEPMDLSSSFPVTDDRERSLEPSSAVSTIDSLAARHERLQAISNNLANLALTPPLPPPHSPSPGPSSAMQMNDNHTPPQSDQSQHSADSAVVLHPLSANQLPSRVGSNVNNMLTDMDYVQLSAALMEEYQTQRRVLVEAAQNLNSALDVLHRVHADSENTFTHQIRAFKEERAAYEHMKRVDVATLQQQSQELQQKHEELIARESNLTLLEKESKAREDARKVMIARRQAQEEEKRAAEAKRLQETKEQIDFAVKEVMEVKALTERARRQFGQLGSETVPDDVPTEPQEGMDKQEIAVVKSRNDLLRDIKHLRQLHMDKLQKLEESDRILRKLEDERKKRRSEEAERRRIAEAELAGQAKDEKRRQFEAEKKRQTVAKGREHTPPLAEQQAPAEAQPHGLKSTSNQGLELRSHPGEVVGSHQPPTADTTRARATGEAKAYSPGTNSMSVDANERASTSHRIVLLPEIHISPVRQGSTSSSKQKNGPAPGGVKLSAPTPKLHGGHLPPKPLSGPPSLPSSDHPTENALNFPKTLSATPMSAESGHRFSFPDQLASEFNRISNADIRSTPDHRPFPRTPKSQTILDPTNGGSQELNIGPAPGVSPTHQNVNLRHLKRSRGRVEENDSGDRSVRRINVKTEVTSSPSVKREEADDHTRELAPASLSTGLPASLPPRPAVIPPPRPWMSKKRHAPQTNSISSFPLESNKNQAREMMTADEKPRDARPGSGQIYQAVNTPIQQQIPAEISNSLLLGPVNSEPQSPETRINTGGRPTQDADDRGSSSESAAAIPPHGLNGGDLPRNNQRFADEHRRARKGKGSNRALDHYSPPSAAPRSTVVSPTQPHRTIDTWRPPISTNGPRAEPMRVGSPTTGRKRPSEFNDSEHGHRARRQRGDVWIAQEHDRGRVDSYRPVWDRRPEPELDERRTAYRTPPSPDRSRAYPSDIQRTAYDNRTYVSPPPEEPVALPPRLEQSYRRPEHDDAYQWYQPPAPSYNAVADQYHRGDTRVGQIYEPMAEERMDVQPEPPLLARMSTNQRVPSTANPRGRGRGEPSRGRSDPSRGRGRSNFAPRGGPTLMERLKNGPSSLGDRLT